MLSKTLAGLLGLVFVVLLMSCALATRVQAAEAPFVVVLDAGHGGEDPGAIDPSGQILEADVTQHVTERLYELLARDERFQVILTHEAGQNPGVNERAAVATAAGADLSVSLHLNANVDNAEASGFQIFPVLPHGSRHAESLRAAQTLSGSMQDAGAAPLDGSGIYYAMYRNRDTKDFFLADECPEGLPYPGRTFGVVQYAEAPALLVEMWFITNAGDMARFNNDKGLQEMAWALYRGIADYAYGGGE